MSYYDGVLTRKERSMKRRNWQERRQKGIEQREERRRREAAGKWAMREKPIRTYVERAERLLRGLRGDVENFYKQVKSRAGIQRISYGWDDRSVLEPGFFCDDAVQRPVAGADRDEIDEFLSKTGMGPRSFMSRRHLKGMAYRLNELGKYLDASPSSMSEYGDLMADLHRTGIYGELVKLNRGLRDLPLCD